MLEYWSGVCKLVGILILAVLCFVGGAALGLWLA